MNPINVLLLGPTNVGKTVYIKRVNTGEFNRNYDATKSFETTKVHFLTNKGPLDIFVHDFSGNTDIDKEISKLKNIDIDSIFVMFDLSDSKTFNKSLEIILKLKKYFHEQDYNSFYKVIIGNKYDSTPRKINQQKIAEIITSTNMYGFFQYYPISAKSCFNFELPFLHISKKIHGYDIIFEDDVINFDDDKFDYIDANDKYDRNEKIKFGKKN
jgi:GTPase SAR1 family protein